MPGTRPNKKELARMKALQDIGETPTSIGKRMGRSHHTIIKYLNDLELFDDPAIKAMINTIREKEVSDLYLLGAKARHRLHTLLDEDQMKAIETTAVMDRSFQQRRLLEGQSTQNIDFHAESKRIIEIEMRLAEIRALKAKDTEG